MASVVDNIDLLNKWIIKGKEVSTAMNFIKKIHNYFEEELTRKEIDAAFVSLFNENTGILKFTIKLFPSKINKSAVVETLILLKYLIHHYQEQISPYIKNIKELSVSCIQHIGTPANVKEKACEVLEEILNGTSWNEDLNIGKLVKVLLHQAQFGKLSPIVLQRVYYILGLLAHLYPEHTASDAEKMLKLYMYELDRQALNPEDVSCSAASGCLEGIAEFLHSFSHFLEENPSQAEKVYNHMKTLASYESSRKLIQRAAMKILHLHGSLFAKYLYNDCISWHTLLQGWVDAPNYDDRVAAEKAIHTFYCTMAAQIQGINDELAKKNLKHFMSFFKSKMYSTDTTIYQKAGVIKGIGIFSAPCSLYTGRDDMEPILIMLIQKAQQLYLNTSLQELWEQNPKYLQLLPDYVQSISRIIMNMRTVNSEHVSSLQYMAVVLLHQFAMTAPKFQPSIESAFTSLLHSLVVCQGTGFDDFVSVVVYQGIIQACGSQKHTYNLYVPLWLTLLKIHSYRKNDISLATKQEIVSKVYDNMLKTIMALLSKLNLSTSNTSNAHTVTEHNLNLSIETQCPEDFQVFIDIVDFSVSVLESTDPQMFRIWVHPLIYFLTSKSVAQPLVCGYYKLLTVCFVLSEKISFFGNASDNVPEQSQSTYRQICIFLEHMISRMKYFKGELQIASIRVFLAAPLPVVPSVLRSAKEVFQRAFRVGHSHLDLAREGLCTLKKWKDSLYDEDMGLLLKSVLPDLETFLQSRGTEISLDRELEALVERRGTVRRRCSLARKKLVEIPDTELSQVQRLILNFLGPLEPNVALALLDCEWKRIPTWGHTKKLKFKMPYKDIRPCIYLDLLLPRTLELALSCGDRQTRIAACEFLHAIIMYILGTSKQIAGSDPQELSDILEKLFMPLLKLGCDTDDVVHQLYYPLVLQFCHWFSSAFQFKSKSSVLFVSTLLDGITHPNDTAVRDLSAKCLKEFVVWAIKQNPHSDLEKSPINIKFIIKKICALCVHPSSSKRFGGAVAFNCMYAVLCEEESVVDEFWLVLLYYMIRNLGQTDPRDMLSGIPNEPQQAVDHIVFIMRKRADMLNKMSKLRKVPQDFEGGTLQHAVQWLLQQCSCVHSECRKKCMELVSVLAPLTAGCNSTQDFITNYVEERGLESLLQIVEEGPNKSGVAKKHIPGSKDFANSAGFVSHWLQLLVASMECYMWLLKEGAYATDMMRNPKSRFVDILSSVFSSKSCNSIFNMDNLMKEPNTPSWEYSIYIQEKCTAIVCVFDFLVVFLSYEKPGSIFEDIPESFFNSSLWNLLINCIFESEKFGFGMCRTNVTCRLPIVIKDFVVSVRETPVLSLVFQNMYDIIQSSFYKHVSSVTSNLTLLLQKNEVSENYKAVARGMLIVEESGILASRIEENTALRTKIIKTICTAIVDRSSGIPVVIPIQPETQAFGDLLLEFAFKDPDQIIVLLDEIQDITALQNKETHASLACGEHILKTFRNSILKFLVHNLKITMDLLLKEIVTNSKQKMFIIRHLLDYIVDNRKETNSVSHYPLSAVLERWETLRAWGQQSAENTSALLLLLKKVTDCLESPVGSLMSHDTGKWILSIITDKDMNLHLNKALNLLPCIVRSPSDDSQELRDAFSVMRSQNFPLFTSGLKSGTKEYNNLIMVFNDLLLALRVSGNVTILFNIIAMSTNDDEHICEDQIQKTLPSFMSRLNENEQMAAIGIAYDIFLNKEYCPPIRKKCITHFVVPLLKTGRTETVVQFFTKHIRQLLDMLDLPVDNPVRGENKHTLVSRLAAWILFENLFACLPIETLESKTCSITQAAFPNSVSTGKELIAHLTRKAFAARSESLRQNMKTETEVIELFRQMQCAAYIALTVIVCFTKNELKFFTGLLFTENKNKNQLLWENIIDCSKTYSFPIVWDEIPKRRKLLVSIRQKAQESGMPVLYIPTDTQILVRSTLAEDVTRFDLNTSVLQDPSNDSVQQIKSTSSEVYLEADALNQHECMATLCGVLEHMIKENIAPVPHDEEKPDALPSWMDNLCKCLLDGSKHPNIHLFLTKLILNNETIFRPYAKFWLQPIMKIIIEGCFGHELNYMVIDVISMIVSWSNIAIPSSNERDKTLASQVLQFLIANAKNNRRDIMKYNLDIIRTLVEVWKECLTIPHQLVQDYLIERTDELSCELGVHISGIILANGLKPWSGTDKLVFLEALIKCMSFAKLLRPTSEVMGMSLKYLDPDLSGALLQENDPFVNLIKKEVGGLERNVDKFLSCLHEVHKHYPPIVDLFMRLLLYQLCKVSGKFQIMCLKTICSRLDVVGGEVYQELEACGLLEMLNHSDSDLQYTALCVVEKMLPSMQADFLNKALEAVLKTYVQNASCKITIYRILMWAYNEHKLNENGKGILLEGLVNKNPTLQELAFKFWNEESHLSSAMPKRLESLLSSLYSPRAEQHFLSYSLNMLLDPIAFSAEYNSNIFEHPLSKCDFKELKVLVSWRDQHSSISRLFTDSIVESQFSYGTSLESLATLRLRATQMSAGFQHTVSGSVNTIGGVVSVPSTSTASSGHVSGIGSWQSYKAVLAVNSTETKPHYPEKKIFSQRFVKDPKQIRVKFASRESRLTARRQQLQQDRLKKRELNVAMYRKYRIGDFPDIQIPHSAVLKPLQVLAQRDALIARQLMVSLFSGVVNELPQGDFAFSTAASQALSNIIKSTCGTSILMGSVLEMALVCRSHVILDTDLISIVSRESGLLMLGSLVLEEKLVSFTENANASAEKQNCWLRLAELYQDMEEWDVVHGIFHEKLECHRSVKEAVEAEVEGSWNRARSFYAEAIASNDPDNQKEYYYEAFFKCLAHLSDWGQLRTCISEQLNGAWDEMWSDSWNRSHLLPYLFTSEIQLMGSSESSEFLNILIAWLQDQEKSEYLEAHLSEELAVMCALEQNFVKAHMYTEKCYFQFLNDWVHMNSLAFKQRATALQSVHRFSELQMFLDVLGPKTTTQELNVLITSWKKNLPTATCSLTDWDRRLAYRTHFLTKLIEKHGENAKQWEETNTEMQLAMISAAVDQNNFHVARKYVGIVKRKLTDATSPHAYQYKIYFSKCKWLRALCTHPVPERLSWMIDATNVLGSCEPCKTEMWKNCLHLQQDACQQMGSFAIGMWTLLKKNPEALETLNPDARRNLCSLIGVTSHRVKEVLGGIHSCGLTYLHCAVTAAQSQVREEDAAVSCHQSQTVATAYFKIAEYYDSTLSSDKLYFTISVFRAMAHGSQEACHLFPRLLQRNSSDTEWIEKFNEESTKVPEWMFLDWISQILACLDKPIGEALYKLCIRLAEAYPQALIWPFRLSRQNYNLSSIPSEVMNRLETLLLQDTLTETFLRAMGCVAQPENVLSHHLRELSNIGKQDDLDPIKLQQAYADLMDEVFAKSSVVLQGSCFTKVHKYKADIEKAFQQILENNKSGLEILKRVKLQLNEQSNRRRGGEAQLSTYSPWLSSFQCSPWDDSLELPGQYNGRRRPLPQHHVKIVGFVQQVSVLFSMRWPVKLSIIGNDAKEYPYLVKYGEDLRQDQRIQQLFELMNVVFSNDSACQHRQQKIITYQVVPLSCRLGIIQWISGTKTLKNFLDGPLTDEEKAKCSSAEEKYRQWLQAAGPQSTKNLYLAHRNAYLHYTREQTVAAYKEKVALVPWDILRRAFWDISTSPEGFFSRREIFASSYAGMCICHWLLGIGDRHLGNCLIREHDGYSVGIDFGYAFGCATEFHPIPELIPFRMTPHIVNLLKPMGKTGLIQGTMVHCLKALRASNQSLLAAMEVFVHEPSINWIELSERQREKCANNDVSSTWLPQEKLSLARKKLEGANPVYISSEELKSGHSRTRLLSSYLSVLAGDNDCNVRTQIGSENLTVHDQVKCLLDLATDPHILGKTWIGWNPWI